MLEGALKSPHIKSLVQIILFLFLKLKCLQIILMEIPSQKHLCI